ncbi:MAG: energy transducer TonB [Saprospiraceae bacterium]|nr:energy transducer TonB [Saprospiraceae bacterium]
MKKEKKEKHFLGKATYPGGIKALQEFLRKNKKYPAEALKHKIEGTVHLRYTINYQGEVIKAQIVAGLGHGCNEEAERIVKMLKFNVPKTRKLRVQYHKTIHIHFRLPKRKPSSAKITYTSTENVTKNDKEGVGKSYTYTIKFN